MGLIAFGPYRVGFWMAERTGAPEVPPAPVAREEGTRVPGGASLVLVAADDEGAPAWSLIVHEQEGASLLLSWGDRLVVGLGTALCLVDVEGRVVARYRTDDEWLTASTTPGGLLLAGRRGVHLLDGTASRLWEWPFEGETPHILGADEESVRLALMKGEDWREVWLDPRTGGELPPRER